MTKLEQTLEAVKDEGLDKEQLENYFSKLSQLRADIRIELAKVQKERALFILKNKELKMNQREAEWRGSELGQREIDLKAYVASLKDALEGIKVRIYALL